jgi:hypothetical protein
MQPQDGISSDAWLAYARAWMLGELQDGSD